MEEGITIKTYVYKTSIIFSDGTEKELMGCPFCKYGEFGDVYHLIDTQFCPITGRNIQDFKTEEKEYVKRNKETQRLQEDFTQKNLTWWRIWLGILVFFVAGVLLLLSQYQFFADILRPGKPVAFLFLLGFLWMFFWAWRQLEKYKAVKAKSEELYPWPEIPS
jgi:hypothetical protein